MTKGDVVKRYTPRVTPKDESKKPYDWRWFGLIAGISRQGTVLEVHRLGDWADNSVFKLELRSPRYVEVVRLEEDQWPDGVWALRTQAMLTGVLDEEK